MDGGDDNENMQVYRGMVDCGDMDVVGIDNLSGPEFPQGQLVLCAMRDGYCGVFDQKCEHQ
jgi:hypothetical protein